MEPTISVIVCGADRGRVQQAAARYQTLLGAPAEILCIDGSMGFAEAFNRGLGNITGELVIFSRDDVEFLASDFRARLFGHMQHCDLLGIAGTVRLCAGDWSAAGPPYQYGQFAIPNPATGRIDVIVWSAPLRRIDNAQAIEGAFLCAKTSTARAVGFDADTFSGPHLFDIDFSFRAFQAGHRLAIANDLYCVRAGLPQREFAWRQAHDRFMAKHGKGLPAYTPRPFQPGMIAVASRLEVVEVMSPGEWDE